MADFLEGLEEAVEQKVTGQDAIDVIPTSSVPQRAEKPRDIREELRSIEDELFRDALEVTADAMDFRKVDPMAEAPPQEWIDAEGEERAWHHFRVAQAAWLPQSKAPAGIKVADQMAGNIIRARATEKSAPQLNVNIVNLPQAPAQYATQKVEE